MGLDSGQTNNRCGLLLMMLLGGGLSACAPTGNRSSSGSSNIPQKPESSYCTTRVTYSPGVTLTAQASFEYRVTSTNLGLGDPVTAGIPYAEVVVTDQNGTVLQCGETSSSGAISLTLPSSSGSYILNVNSRSMSSKLKISVLEDYYENVPYTISKNFTVATGVSTVNAGTITAKARFSAAPKIEGGAFHIMYRIWQANEYLRATTGSPSLVAPKVSVYWKMGHNPHTYFGGTSLLSFYRPGTSELFILGGDHGDVMVADTDHFDSSVILHEYGHFLEDIYANSDSPGGSHNGNFIIDPRLAWSEGWANFFQAAVLHHFDSTWKYYVDTYGVASDSVESGTQGGLSIKFELTMTNGRCASSPPFSLYNCDPVQQSGEGTFREVSISRFLFKSIIPNSEGGAAVPFAAVWSAFSNTQTSGQPSGLASSQVRFRNIGRFNEFLKTQIQTYYPVVETDWNTVITGEKQNTNRKDYAAPLVRQTLNSCPATTISPVVDQSSGSQVGSNLLRSNDFYEFSYDGGGGTLYLTYTGGSSNMDLDLFVYVENHVLQEAWESENGTLVARSDAYWATEQGTEALSLNGLAAGTYLINVKAYTEQKTSGQLSGQSANYNLKFQRSSVTEDLCPAP